MDANEIKMVIFDMDGVIIDSEAQHAKASLNTFKELGVDTDLDYCKSFNAGHGTMLLQWCERDVRKKADKSRYEHLSCCDRNVGSD